MERRLKKGLRAGLALASLSVNGSSEAFAATPLQSQTPEAEVRQADAAFWNAYNRCDERAMESLFTVDAEFYHDKTGLNTGRKQVAQSMMRGPCADPKSSRLRREPIDETIRYDPLAGGFALLSGEHRFLLTPQGAPEQPSGMARFTTVWQRVGARWLMRRVVSYAHGPDVPQLVMVPVSREVLARLTGTYAGEGGADAQVRIEGGVLILASGGAVFRLVPIGPGRFGVIGRPLQFAFGDDAVEVLENGATVVRMRRSKAGN